MMVRILAIGDPHGEIEKIKRIHLAGVNLILLTGDLGNASLLRKIAFENIERKKRGLPEIKYGPQEKRRGFMEAYNSTIRLVKYLSKYSPVYTIYGNVESSNSETRELSKEIGLPLPLLTDNLNSINGVRIINNRIANFQGIRIGGLDYFRDTSWVREFKPSDYREKLKSARKETEKTKKILNNFGSLDVLVCHQPPYGVLDKVTAKFAPKSWYGKHAGSQTILNYIKKYQPDYVFCGHIHEGEGMKKVGRTQIYNLGVAGYRFVEL
jgi:Icc-related predicted phosphoesterase